MAVDPTVTILAQRWDRVQQAAQIAVHYGLTAVEPGDFDDVEWRYVSPEPPRGATVGVDAVLKLVKQYGATCERLGNDYLAETLLERESLFAAIRAMLEPLP